MPLPGVPLFDPIHRAELHASIEYELFAIDEFRIRVHVHRDAVVAPISHTLGELMPDGTPMTRRSGVMTASGCESAVRAALQPLRPLLFGATFKVLDLIVEWLLLANGVSRVGAHWPMTEKLPQLRKVNHLPPELAGQKPVWDAFVETYAKLIEPRHVVVHREGVRVQANGDIELATKPSPVVLSDAMQSALTRATSLLGHSFGGTCGLDSVALIRLESAFSELATLHGVKNLSSRPPRPTVLTIDVPDSRISSRSPLECAVDFNEVANTWRYLERDYPTYAVVGELIIRPNGAPAGWSFDPDSLPVGDNVVLREGDPNFDSFLISL